MDFHATNDNAGKDEIRHFPSEHNLVRNLYQVIEQIADSVMITDRSGKIEYVNPAFEKISGYRSEEVLGKNPRLLKSGIHDDAHYEQLWETILTGDPFQSPMANRRKDGTIYYVEKTITPIRDELGNIIHFVSTDKDITERKLVEEEAEKLRQAKAEDLENFAFIASHDLQEPLRMITSYLALLEKHCGDVLDKNAREFLNFATDGAKRMRALIDDLLSYCRIENTKRPFALVDLEEILEEALTNLGQRISETNAVITHDALPKVYGEQIQLVQLFQNLIGNAIKYRGNHPPLINIGIQEEKAHWVLLLRDNGIGIASHNKERVFGMFQRLHSRAEYAGTGLGLAICKRIVERHQGAIWFESELGHGTTFFIRLPKIDANTGG